MSSNSCESLLLRIKSLEVGILSSTQNLSKKLQLNLMLLPSIWQLNIVFYINRVSIIKEQYYQMEYQKKKKQILANIEYSSLLSFTLVENKLERNFKSIVQALLLTQTEGSQLKEDLHALTKSTSRQIAAVNEKVGQLEKKIQELQNKQESLQTKYSLKKFAQKEESGLEKQQEVISSPKLNFNFVQSPPQTEECIPSVKNVKEIQIFPEASKNNEENNEMKRNLEDLKEKLNNLTHNFIDPNELDKKLSTMKDSINLLKAQMKALSDREAKSARRVSLMNAQKFQSLTPQGPNNTSQKQLSQINVSNAANESLSAALRTMQDELQREMNNIHIEMNTMKLFIEELKQAASQNKRKQNKLNIQVDQLAKNQKKISQKLQSSNESFEGQLKDVKMQLLNIQTKPQSDADLSKKSKKQIESKDSKENVSPNANQQVNDRISKLQAAIQGLVTEAQFKRFKSEANQKFSTLQNEDENIRKQLKEQVQMLTQILDSKEVQLANIQKDIDEIKEKLTDMNSQNERKNNINISRCQQLKKNLQNLKEDLQFYKSMNQNSFIQPKISNQSNQQEKDSDRKMKSEELGKTTQELKKYLNRKLHDQRTYLLGLIRDLQKKSGNKSNVEQDLVGFWDKIAEINLFLHKKANEQDVKKNLSYLQKKLAALYQRITSADENNQDARIAKTNWFCLSCDKSLHNYQGKVGQHVVWDSMPIKAGHTKYYNKDDKKSLPTLKR